MHSTFRSIAPGHIHRWGGAGLIVARRSDLPRAPLLSPAEQRVAASTPPLLRGEDVMARFRLEPGPSVGWLLEQAREAQDLGRIGSREEALAYLDSLVAGP